MASEFFMAGLPELATRRNEQGRTKASAFAAKGKGLRASIRAFVPAANRRGFRCGPRVAGNRASSLPSASWRAQIPRSAAPPRFLAGAPISWEHDPETILVATSGDGRPQPLHQVIQEKG